MKKLIALVALTGAITAQAQSRFVADGPEDTLYREGIATYSDNKGLVATSWFSMTSKINGDSGKWLMQIHCETGLIRTIRTIVYSYNNIVQNSNENWNASWRNPVPGAFESKFQQACYTR